MIASLEFRGFRGHDKSYQFSPGRNIIKGPNEAGKTTIKEAIAFTWMGTDSYGTKNPDHLITVGLDTTEVRLKTARSGFARKKKRGSTSEVKLQREGVPDVKLSQTDLMTQIGISQEVFMSSWVTGYFMAQDQKTKLKVLGEIAKIDRKSLLYDLIGPDIQIPSQVKFVNPKIDADVVARMRREEQNKRQASDAILKSLLDQKATIPTDIATIDQNDYNNRIAVADIKLQEVDLYEKNLSAWKVENNKRSTASSIIAQLQEEEKTVTTELNKISKEAEKLEKKLADLGVMGKSILEEKAKIESMKKTLTIQQPVKPKISSGTCPTCGHTVSQEQIDAIMKPYSDEVDAYNKAAREVQDFNNKVTSEILALDKKLGEERLKYENSNKEYQCHNNQKIRLTEKLNSIRSNIENTKKIPTDLLQAPVAPSHNVVEIKAERDKLKAELHSYNMFKTQLEQLNVKIAEQENLIKGYFSSAQKYATIEAALLKLPSLETEKTLEKIQISGVKMSLVNDELVVENEAGVDYRCLSDGRKMRVDIGICLAIKKAEPKCPDWVFVDNADLVDEDIFVPSGIQLLVAQVDSSVDTVEVVSL